MVPLLELARYVTIIVCVPSTHVEVVKKAMWQAGAGKWATYSCCTFSQKGIANFMPSEDSTPFIGQDGQLLSAAEERLEMPCALEDLENVIEAIKKVHPYEETVIDIIPIYQIGIKTKSGWGQQSKS